MLRPVRGRRRAPHAALVRRLLRRRRASSLAIRPSRLRSAAAAEAPQVQDGPAAPRQGDGIDLIIDKLPRHGLVKPIPVTIAPLGTGCSSRPPPISILPLPAIR